MVSDARLICGDVLNFARHYHGELFHALLCDPPYHLNSIVKRFGANGAKPATDGVYARSSKGFMGKKWDGGDIAFRPDTWAALAGLLYPGAFGMAFAGSRGWHRMAVAIEDAGLVVHPTIFGWLYGSGFPKATRISKGTASYVDKRNGPDTRANTKGDKYSGGYTNAERDGVDADTWAGHRYGLQALKPALEPIIVFQRPYDGKPVDSITRTGAGALNVDGARIPGPGWDRPIPDNPAPKFQNTHAQDTWTRNEMAKGAIEHSTAGRWPANFVLDGETAKRLDAQSGKRSVTGKRSIKSKGAKVRGTAFGPDNHQSTEYAGESGMASRFYFQADWNLEHADPVLYMAKSSRRERDAGLGDMPLQDSAFNTIGFDETKRDRQPRNIQQRNPHPTVKPIALVRWLATLLLPPVEYAPRRLLVPFSGVASEMIGAALAGWECVVGIEGEAEYVPLGRARLAHWLKQDQLELAYVS